MFSPSPLLVLISVFTCSDATDQRNITAETGQNAILPCRLPDSKPVVAVEWSRTGLGSEYVLLYRNEQIDPENQHPSFKDRVDLQDRQLKDGDVSLVLKNVTTDDEGTYQCHVFQEETNNEKIFTINLEVVPPGEPDGSNDAGSSTVVVALIAGVALIVAIVLIFKYKKHVCLKPKPNRPPKEAAEPQQNLMGQNQPADL